MNSFSMLPVLMVILSAAVSGFCAVKFYEFSNRSGWFATVMKTFYVASFLAWVFMATQWATNIW